MPRSAQVARGRGCSRTSGSRGRKTGSASAAAAEVQAAAGLDRGLSSRPGADARRSGRVPAGEDARQAARSCARRSSHHWRSRISGRRWMTTLRKLPMHSRSRPAPRVTATRGGTPLKLASRESCAGVRAESLEMRQGRRGGAAAGRGECSARPALEPATSACGGAGDVAPAGASAAWSAAQSVRGAAVEPRTTSCGRSATVEAALPGVPPIASSSRRAAQWPMA